MMLFPVTMVTEESLRFTVQPSVFYVVNLHTSQIFMTVIYVSIKGASFKCIVLCVAGINLKWR